MCTFYGQQPELVHQSSRNDRIVDILWILNDFGTCEQIGDARHCRHVRSSSSPWHLLCHAAGPSDLCARHISDYATRFFLPPL